MAHVRPLPFAMQPDVAFAPGVPLQNGHGLTRGTLFTSSSAIFLSYFKSQPKKQIEMVFSDHSDINLRLQIIVKPPPGLMAYERVNLPVSNRQKLYLLHFDPNSITKHFSVHYLITDSLTSTCRTLVCSLPASWGGREMNSFGGCRGTLGMART